MAQLKRLAAVGTWVQPCKKQRWDTVLSRQLLVLACPPAHSPAPCWPSCSLLTRPPAPCWARPLWEQLSQVSIMRDCLKWKGKRVWGAPTEVLSNFYMHSWIFTLAHHHARVYTHTNNLGQKKGWRLTLRSLLELFILTCSECTSFWKKVLCLFSLTYQ